MLLFDSQVIGKARVPIIKFLEMETNVAFDIRLGQSLFFVLFFIAKRLAA